jgi:hypothetical protein
MKPGNGGLDFDKIEAKAMAAKAHEKLQAVTNARQQITNEVLRTLPTMRVSENSRPSNNGIVGQGPSNKKAYWEAYYDMPPEARGQLQPGVRKAWYDIADKAFKSAGI